MQSHVICRKGHLITSVKNPAPFVITNSEETRHGRNISQIIKTMYGKPTASILLSVEKWEVFPLTKKTRVPTAPLLLSVELQGLARKMLLLHRTCDPSVVWSLILGAWDLAAGCEQEVRQDWAVHRRVCYRAGGICVQKWVVDNWSMWCRVFLFVWK